MYVLSSALPVAPTLSIFRSSDLSPAISKTWPDSNNRTSDVPRFRFQAIMPSIPGTRELRMTDCSALKGLASMTVCLFENACASAGEMNVEETASSYPSASSSLRRRASLAAPGSSITPPEKRRKRVGKFVVAVNARDLFNQVNLAFNIQTPGRQVNNPAGLSTKLLEQVGRVFFLPRAS